jgi:hypothetical protein
MRIYIWLIINRFPDNYPNKCLGLVADNHKKIFCPDPLVDRLQKNCFGADPLVDRRAKNSAGAGRPEVFPYRGVGCPEIWHTFVAIGRKTRRDKTSGNLANFVYVCPVI